MSGYRQADAQPVTVEQRAKILVVDGQELFGIGLRSLLAATGQRHIQFIEAASLREAMERYRVEVDISLVLLDLNLPDCRGLNGLRQFVEAFPRARVAARGTTQDEFVVDQVRALGAVGYLPKALTPSHLAQLVGCLLCCESRAFAKARLDQGLAGLTPFPRSSKRMVSSATWSAIGSNMNV